MNPKIPAHKVKPDGDCLIWTGAKTRLGYGIAFTSRKIGKRKQKYVHRLAYEAVNGAIPDGLFVLHSCDRPSCINPAHLRVGTHDENMRDKVERNRQFHPAMERNGRRKLSCDVVVKIREQLNGRPFMKGERKAIAEQYGVTGQAVYMAATRKTWVVQQ